MTFQLFYIIIFLFSCFIVNIYKLRHIYISGKFIVLTCWRYFNICKYIYFYYGNKIVWWLTKKVKAHGTLTRPLDWKLLSESTMEGRQVTYTDFFFIEEKCYLVEGLLKYFLICPNKSFWLICSYINDTFSPDFIYSIRT